MFQELLDKHEKISIVTHQSFDTDSLGTGLAIYSILKNLGKEVEISNMDAKLPNYLDFLPHFAKIKNRMDFDNSFIIACNLMNLNVLNFDVSLRDIVTIDHDDRHEGYALLNSVDNSYASISMGTYNFLKHDFEITKEVATCFYVGLVTTTQNFTTSKVNSKTFTVASELLALGVNLEKVNKNLMQRKSLSSFRLLSYTLKSLELSHNAELAFLVVDQETFEQTGANKQDLIGLIDYGLALATVKIAILLVELEEHIKVSFRSDKVSVSGLARHFGGGGHCLSSGFTSKKIDLNKLLNEIKLEIKERRLLNEL
ncbi:MAG: Phosphoesterase [uncultured Sulfurovum sp.]|uniref:Phosphoesterase n=1 Tax=uncultured Sulfurovum sp. TaxID=269237 RepID=A0A6S6SQJ5_9BACT|nr:MAG: Phosphoesterase [uncultured Sulfurovum sp.]